ncbi:phage/plasmid primase, P4 family [Streptomyces sp. DK15]|uniref:phage/plasmid primase, P4 family n=1 Tax=Streptomyces sp. DK15 TaxID=2957499 RepID=UPI0029B00A92|nr:phage/plasmid primase, P4 family [Streptomyces sp. DK15]MDX2390201.1 phage/plasmid primase, P4 family [Streptomyces sp. DK15]
MRFDSVLARFTEVSEEYDGGYLALCPAHSDSRPSLRIWRGDDLKVRLTCRAGCETADVVKAAGLVWGDLFNATGDGLTVAKERPAMVGPGPTAALAAYVDTTTLALGDYSSATAADALSYLDRRFGIDLETAAELMIGVDDGAVPGFPYRSRAYLGFPRITVPLADFKGVARGLQGRDITGQCPKRWLSLSNPEGARWAPYGVFRGQSGYGVTLVTEGPGDALTAVAVGYDAVAIRGASLSHSPEIIAELAAGLRGTQVIVCGDNDKAGTGFTSRLADGLAAHGVDVFTLEVPYEGADLTDWRERVGARRFPDELHRAVKVAQPVAGKPGSAVVDADTGALVPDADEAARAVRLMTELADRYGSSDVLNAHALVSFTRGHIKYAAGLGYYVWNGTTWERSETRVRQAVHYMGAALTVAAAELTAAHKATGGDAKNDPGERLRKVAKGFTLTRNIDALMRELRAVPSVHVDAADFDARPDLLTFRNGTVNLRTGELKPHDQRDMLTYALDINYVADAQCPRWERFLDEIFPGNPELPGFMRRMTGYGITGHVSEQCFAVFWGKGANGKSVLTDTLTHVFRTISKTTPFATFEEKGSGGIPNDIAALRGSRLVMASEGESGKPMSEAILKRVTGKDMIAARFLRQEFFEFKPSFLLMLATNHKPKFRGQDEGLWRRVKMIPFKRWFAPEERDHNLDTKLAAEAEGIAAWAVRGAVEWFREGLQDPEVIKKAVKEYRETSDALAGFYPGALEPCDDMCQTPGNDAFNLYLEWCEAENLPGRERWTRTTFYTAMEERGVTRKKTNKGIALVGCRIAGQHVPATGPGIFAK